MSNSYSAGYYADEAVKVRESKCRRGGEHDWEHYFPESPSAWGTCRKCQESYFNK